MFQNISDILLLSLLMCICLHGLINHQARCLWKFSEKYPNMKIIFCNSGLKLPVIASKFLRSIESVFRKIMHQSTLSVKKRALCWRHEREDIWSIYKWHKRKLENKEIHRWTNCIILSSTITTRQLFPMIWEFMI